MPVKKGDKVKLHLSGKVKNGKVFATTEGKKPVEFRAGAGEILPGIDEQVIGMEKGEEKEITVPAEKGFGKKKEELVMKVAKDVFEGKKLGTNHNNCSAPHSSYRISCSYGLCGAH